MPHATALQVTTLVLQGAVATLTAVLFRTFQEHYRSAYLRYWTWSWIALGVHTGCGAAAISLSGTHAVTSPLRATFATVAAVAGYVQIAFLLIGTQECASGVAVARREVRNAVIGMVLLGLLTVSLFVWDPDADRIYFVRVGLRRLAAGAAFLGAAWTLIRGDVAGVVARPAHASRRSLGRRVVTIGFLLFAAQQLHFFLVGADPALRAARQTYLAYLGFVDLLLQLVIGAGTVIWLLEDERRAAMDAAAHAEHLASHDALTGLANRRLFHERLATAVAEARGVAGPAVCFLDLDRFKIVNDSLGHSLGDQLLREVAGRLAASLPDGHTLTRLGGDEFAVLAPRVAGPDAAVALARRVRATFRDPFVVGGRELYAGSSVGVSVYPDGGRDAESLLKNADAAMYRAKARRRDSVELYTPDLGREAEVQLATEVALRRALDRREFVLAYQPVASCTTGRVTAVEALLRWHHPERGILPPADFIAAAEATGLIVPIGAWVLGEGCRQLAAWRDAGIALGRVAVNVSYRQLQQPSFVGEVREALRVAGLPASSLELEITESVAAEVGDGSTEALEELDRLGVRIAVDDFGTGFSSLAGLRAHPVDSLKIDRSFVAGVPGSADDTAIAASVIALARTLHKQVVAEGVERPEQLRFLAEHGCDEWQGYLLNRPLDAGEMYEFLVGGAAPSVDEATTRRAALSR